MHIGIVGPFETNSMIDLIGSKANDLPKGYIGAPIISLIARELVNRGHKVTIFTTDNTLLPDTVEPVKFKAENLTIYYCPSRPKSFRSKDGYKGRITDFFKFERDALIKVILNEKPDILHAHWCYEFAWAAIDSDLPNLITIHDSPPKVLKYIPTLYRFGRYLMARQVMKRAKALTTVSPYMQKEIMRWSSKDTNLVPNGLEQAWFDVHVPPETKDISNPKLAMITNGWINLKNAKSALNAFKEIKLTIPSSELHVFGYGFGLGEDAHEWCLQRGLTTGVIFHGNRPHDELKEHLKEYHLLIHPSLEESFGMTVLESMALGIPVIGGSHSGAVPWLLAEHKHQLLTDVKDPHQIYTAVIKILADSTEYNVISTQLRARAEKMFLIPKVVDQYLEQYSAVLSTGKS